MFLGERAGGVGRYARELAGALLAAEPATEVHVFLSREAPRDLREQPWARAVRWVTLPVGTPTLRTGFELAVLPALARARRLDVLHSPANTGPAIVAGLASVITLHDLIWWHRASEWEASATVQRRMRMLVRHCVRHADRLITVSQASAEDIARTLDVPRERIDVTPHGVHAPAGPPSVPEAQLRERLQLGQARVVLCVAQKRPYKNLHSLVRALAQLDGDVVLVLPGSATAYELELRALAEALGVAGRVRFPDWLSDDELDALYALSEVFALPSLLEGFGMPVLEAMVRGVPVACSNASSLPEVAGDAALLFDSERQEEVTAAIRRLLDDRELAARLVARGREQAARFTWRRTGELTLEGYRRAVAARGSRAPATRIS
jgi:glycosyltransferase involved in cell wall biosynthesis